MERIRKFFSSGIEEAREKISKHVDLSLQSFKNLQSLFSSRDLSRSDVDEVVRKITAFEREGDEIFRKLIDEVVRGSVVPTVTNVVLILLDNVDNVLDLAYFAVKEIKRGFYLWKKDYIYAIINSEIKEMLNITNTMLEYLQSMLRIRKSEELRQYANLINTLEEEIDEIKENILDKIYGLELTPVEFNHLVTLIYTIDKIADNIQDAAHHLATISSL